MKEVINPTDDPKEQEEIGIVHELMGLFTKPVNLAGMLILLTGQSGSGKGTQLGILKRFLAYCDIPFISQTNGEVFRNFIKTTNPRSQLRKMLVEREALSQRQNYTLPFAFFLEKLKNEYTGEQVVFLDGSPRSEEEFFMLKSFLHDSENNITGLFSKIIILNLEVKEETAIQRMLEREGDRADSKDIESIKRKMSWFGEVEKLLQKINSVQGQSDERYGDHRISMVSVDSERPKFDVAKSLLEGLYITAVTTT